MSRTGSKTERVVERCEEEGGVNLYKFADNDAINNIYLIGLLELFIEEKQNVPSEQMYKFDSGDIPAATTEAIPEFEYAIERCGPLLQKKRITDLRYKLKIIIKYRKPQSARLSGGETIAEHEGEHVRIYSEGHSKIENAWLPYVGKCICEPCFSRIDEWLLKTRELYLIKMEYLHALFDCNVYPDGVNKTEVCNKKNTSLFEFERIQQEVQKAKQKLTETCGDKI